jgi:glutamate transport system substrate-binding protein
MRSRTLIASLAVASATAAIFAPVANAAKATKKPAAKKVAPKAAPATTAAPAATAAPATTPPATAAPAAAAPAAGGATLADLKKKGKITIGVKFDVPLIGLKNPVTGDIGGFDVEMGKIIAKAIYGTDKGKIEFVEAISANRIPFLKDNKVDLILSTFSITDARKKEVDMAGPYYVAGQDLLIYKVEVGNIKSITDVKKVCAQTGSTSIANIKAANPTATVLDLPTTANCVEALKDGRVDAVSTDDTLLAGFAEKNPQFALVGKQFSVERYGVGLKFGDTAFRNYVNDVLEASFKDGSWKKAVEATIGTGGIKVPDAPKVDRYTL